MKIVATMALAFLGLGAAAWAFISRERAETARFETTAEAASGTVMEKSQIFSASPFRPDRRRHVLAYNFKTATGTEVNGTDEVDPTTWNHLKRGDNIRVYYLSDAPKTNHLRLQSAALNDVNWAQLVVVSRIGSLFVVVFILLWRRV
jgi:hypothetical protein